MCPQLRVAWSKCRDATYSQMGHTWEGKIPLQSTRAEDGLVVPSRHTCSLSTEHHMGSTHTSVHGDRRPLKHHLRCCGGCGPTRSFHWHSSSHLPSWYPICIPGTGLHQSSQKKSRTCSVRHRLTTMTRTATADGSHRNCGWLAANHASRSRGLDGSNGNHGIIMNSIMES